MKGLTAAVKKLRKLESAGVRDVEKIQTQQNEVDQLKIATMEMQLKVDFVPPLEDPRPRSAPKHGSILDERCLETCWPQGQCHGN